MQIPVLSGIYSDENSELRTSYPRNMIPVVKDSGISKGYLRPAEGIVEFAAADGIDRGGINWNGIMYRVLGSKLCQVLSDGSIRKLGDVGSGGRVSLDYSFDRLAIASADNLFYYDGATLTQVTDVDLGNVIDFIWVDGYFLTTDGTNLVVTELNDPYSVLPTKYGSSEADPDPVVALLKLRDEPIALNRYTIETFNNVGGDNFPFQRVQGALINRGAIGTHACCIFAEAIAFLGSNRNEAPAIWLGLNGASTKLSTREIDLLIGQYTEDQLSEVVMEKRVDKNHQLLYVHLPTVTVVYDIVASQEVGEPIWFTLTSGLEGLSQYFARNLVWCYDRWNVGHTTLPKIGYYDISLASHWSEVIGWDFGTMILYNASKKAIFYELELVVLNGRAILGDQSTVWTSHSLDGETWSVERGISAGKRGERNKRLRWLQQGFMYDRRIQRFRGTSDSMLTIIRLEAQVEGLN